MTHTRPLWVVTLADLALLLVGFLVLLHARQDDAAVARALQARFGNEAPLAVAAEQVDAFAPGSAALPRSMAPLQAWAAEQLRDPRVALTVTGSVDGSPADVDPSTRSGELLALDRARAVAARLPPARVRTATARNGRRVTVTLAFAGERIPE